MSKRRLSTQPGEVLDRQKSLRFSFDGDMVEAYEGDTIASALAASGREYLSRSFKYHRPRGLLCCSGHCPNCLVQVGDEPNVRACRRPVEAGLKVSSQNVWPRLDFDLMAWLSLGDFFMPVGFYYKTFIRPRALWPLYEQVIRSLAGLGRVHLDSIHGSFLKEYLHYDVVVVGGGPSGLEAALAAADSELRVAIFDENPSLGGHLRFSHQRDSLVPLLEKAGEHPALDVFTDTTVLGRWEEGWLSAEQGNVLYKVRAGAVIVATGAVEQPFVFENNDLPGIMLSSACQRLIQLHAVRPGEQAVVVTCDDSGWETAALLKEAGIEVVAVADHRAQTDSKWRALLQEGGVRTLMEHHLISARGKNRVTGVRLGSSQGGPTDIECDLVAMAGGWVPQAGLVSQAGGKLGYHEPTGEFLPREVPAGTFVVGRADGLFELGSQRAQGRHAGRRATAFLGRGEEPEAFEAAEDSPRGPLAEPAPGRKRFVCVCEDVTVKDLEQAISEGYRSIELLKRYSTISMGPCQGRMCSMNSIRLCARNTSRPLGEVGTTTSRPPMMPVKLGVLAGQNMEPVRYTPMHDWHRAGGARMMVAGLWMRPEHYGDPASEVHQVRNGLGLIDLSTLGKFMLRGPGVPDFLDKVYVNKWQKLEVGRVRYGVMTTDEGVVYDDGVTARLDEDLYLMTTTSSGSARVFETLQWWMQSGWGEGVILVDQTDERAAMNLAGPRSRQLLEELVDAGQVDNESFPYLHLRELNLCGIDCQLMRIGFTGELSYEIHCPRASALHLWTELLKAGEEFGITPFGVEAQRIMRLEKAHLIVGQDTDATSDPISAGMKWAVKLDKEDFLGRWALSRIDAEGSSSRLVGYQMIDTEVVPHEGEQVVADGNTVGWVTSSRFSPTLSSSIGLCWVPKELSEEGCEISILTRGTRRAARVCHGPFYDPAGEKLRS